MVMTFQEREQGESPVYEIPLSIRRKCMELEAAIAPELEDPENVITEQDNLIPARCYKEYPFYTEIKWKLILKKTDDVRVKRLIALMKKSKVPKDNFCKTMGEFIAQPTQNINLVARPLSKFTPEEVKSSLKLYFDAKVQQDSKIAIKSITHVLMKVH